jgi:hypothetical protein
MELSKTPEVSEAKKPDVPGFRDIKPDTDMSSKDAGGFWDKVFESTNESGTFKPETAYEKKESLESMHSAYIKDLKEKSPVPDTIDSKLDPSKIEKIPAELNAEKRSEFNTNKDRLIKEWEAKTNTEWPTYDKDVYNNKGTLIRKAGGRYDAHHIQPLCLGGENRVTNITPLHANDHYDKQGVHASGSPYEKLTQAVQ